MTDDPKWIIPCGRCQKYAHNERGEISTYDMPDGKGGLKKVPLEMQGPPPCGSCPKHSGDAERKPLGEAEDYFGQEWFWAVRQHFLECRAVGDFENPDAFLRSVIAEFDQAERRGEGRAANRTAAAMEEIAYRRS